MKIMTVLGAAGKAQGSAGGTAGPKNSPGVFGQCEASKGISPGCTGGLARAVTPGPVGTGVTPTLEGAALPYCSLHTPVLMAAQRAPCHNHPCFWVWFVFLFVFPR